MSILYSSLDINWLLLHLSLYGQSVTYVIANRKSVIGTFTTPTRRMRKWDIGKVWPLPQSRYYVHRGIYVSVFALGHGHVPMHVSSTMTIVINTKLVITFEIVASAATAVTLLMSPPKPFTFYIRSSIVVVTTKTLHNRSSIVHATTKPCITTTALLLSPPKPCISTTTLIIAVTTKTLHIHSSIIDCCHHQTFRHKNKKEKTPHEVTPNPSVPFPSRYDELHTLFAQPETKVKSKRRVECVNATRSQSKVDTTRDRLWTTRTPNNFYLTSQCTTTKYSNIWDLGVTQTWCVVG